MLLYCRSVFDPLSKITENRQVELTNAITLQGSLNKRCARSVPTGRIQIRKEIDGDMPYLDN